MGTEKLPFPLGATIVTGIVEFSDGQRGLLILPSAAKNIAHALDGLSVFGDYDGSKTSLLGSLLSLCRILSPDEISLDHK